MGGRGFETEFLLPRWVYVWCDGASIWEPVKFSITNKYCHCKTITPSSPSGNLHHIKGLWDHLGCLSSRTQISVGILRNSTAPLPGTESEERTIGHLHCPCSPSRLYQNTLEKLFSFFSHPHNFLPNFNPIQIL